MAQSLVLVFDQPGHCQRTRCTYETLLSATSATVHLAGCSLDPYVFARLQNNAAASFCQRRTAPKEKM